jgi:hypothetical protein
MNFQAALRAPSMKTSRLIILLAWRPGSDATTALRNFSKIKVTIAGRPELKVAMATWLFCAQPITRKPKRKPSRRASGNSRPTILGLTETTEGNTYAARRLVTHIQPAATWQIQPLAVQVTRCLSNDSFGKLEANVLGAVFDSRGKPVGISNDSVKCRAPARTSNPALRHV